MNIVAWPTTNDPRTEFVTTRFTVSEAGGLDAYAALRGMTRSQAVRDAVSRCVAADRRRTNSSKAREATSKSTDAE